MEIKAKTTAIHTSLCAEYGCPIPFFHHLDPLSELVSSLLSHRTRNHDSGRAFKALRAQLPTWELVRDAAEMEVRELIAAATWPEQKAPRIQAILREITRLRDGVLALEFLGDWPVADARHWLEQLNGVGPKTSAAVLLFSTLRRPALPVDCHHQRVAERLGLIPRRLSSTRMHDILAAQLPADYTAQQVYDHHEILMLHGQRCCFVRSPACSRCVVLDLCPDGQSRLATGTKPAPKAPGVLPPHTSDHDQGGPELS